MTLGLNSGHLNDKPGVCLEWSNVSLDVMDTNHNKGRNHFSKNTVVVIDIYFTLDIPQAL